MDYYLRADSETAMWNSLEAAGAAKQIQIKDEQGNVIRTEFVPEAGYNIDVIGTIYKPTGNMIQQTLNGLTSQVPEMAALPGFHANMRGPGDLAEKVEYVPYQPTAQELADPNFVMPPPTVVTTPSPIAALLVSPKSPSRVWF